MSCNLYYLFRLIICTLFGNVWNNVLYTVLCVPVHLISCVQICWYRKNKVGFKLQPAACIQWAYFYLALNAHYTLTVCALNSVLCPVHYMFPCCIVYRLYRLYPVSWSSEILWQKWRSRFHLSFSTKTNWFISGGGHHWKYK